jgi:hypothetical protein
MKKIKSTKTILEEKKFIKRKKENHAWNLVIIYNILKKKTT